MLADLLVTWPLIIIPPPTRSSGQRYSVLLLKFLSFFLSFFPFAKGSPRWLYGQGTFVAQIFGYRRNFKNWVQNLWGQPPIKICGTPNPQCCHPKLEDVVQTYSRNRPWERVSKTGFKILGAPHKKFEGGQILEILILKLAFLRGHGSHALQIFTSGSGSWCLTYVPVGGPLPQKNLGGEIFPNPLGSRGVVQIFFGNSPWKEVPKTGFKILGAPPQKKKLQGVIFSPNFAIFRFFCPFFQNGARYRQSKNGFVICRHSSTRLKKWCTSVHHELSDPS